MPLRNPPTPAQDASSWSPPGTGLSNDYLNHYSELLMLIETASEDRELAGELRRWKPLDYRSYFAASPLRRAEAALRAYDALPVERRFLFEKLIRAMDQLAEMAILAVDLKEDRDTAAFVPAATAPIVRRLIARAASFLNSNGAEMDRAGEVAEAQQAIDRLMSCVGSAEEAA
jgi:hypothetical protein